MKNILFISPSKGLRAPGFHPNLGLGYLAGMLKDRHKVTVADYNGCDSLPPLEEVLNRTSYDLIGVSSFTPTWSAADEVIDICRRTCGESIPVILGGPHASCYLDRLTGDKRLDYIVTGEAEDIILKLADEANRQPGKPVVIYGNISDLKALPEPDFTSFLKYREITSYPLMLTRGCPYNCSFCAVKLVSSNKWRYRYVDDCISEIKGAVKTYPNLEKIVINDDNFTLKLDMAKEFIRKYLDLKIAQELEVSNVRADRIDKELLDLLKEAKCFQIGIGIEHGDQEVFDFIDKKVDFEKIREAAAMIKGEKMKLAACMVIGLPYDTLQKTRESIKLVKELKADIVFWNMIFPFRGTKVYDWYKQHGKINEQLEQCFQPSDDEIFIEEVSVETPEFTADERRKAYLMARLSSGMFSFKHWKPLIKVFPKIVHYGLIPDLISGLYYGFTMRVKRQFRYYLYFR